MNRILILGNPGSGKSTLAVKLGAILHLPVVHLDKLYWQPGWVEPDSERWTAIQHRLVEGDEWIIDGNYVKTLELRLQYADTIISLDYTTAISLWRIIRRTLNNYGRIRPDMGDGCPEKLDLAFIRFCWQFNRRYKPVIDEKIRQHFNGDTYVKFKKPSDVRRYLSTLTGKTA